MITLHAARLTFVSLGAKVHAQDSVYGTATMCGRDVAEGTAAMPERKIRIGRLCGRCLMTLRTYNRLPGKPQQVSFEKEDKS